MYRKAKAKTIPPRSKAQVMDCKVQGGTFIIASITNLYDENRLKVARGIVKDLLNQPFLIMIVYT